MSQEFGPVIDYARVENAIRDQVLKPWMDTYLIVVERENSMTPRTIRRPRDWKVLDDLRVTPEKNLPVVYIVSGGETDDPQDDGEGRLWSTITMAAVVAMKDTTRDTTRETTRRYSAAVAALIDHKLGTAGLGIRLTSRPRQLFDEALSEPPRASAYIFGLAYVTFTAQIDVVRYSRGGPDDPFPEPITPRDPDAPPNPSDPDRTSVNVDIDVIE